MKNKETTLLRMYNITTVKAVIKVIVTKKNVIYL